MSSSTVTTSQAASSLGDADEYALRHYAVVLRRRWLSIALPLVVLAIAGVALAPKGTPTYSSRAEVLVASGASSRGGSGSESVLGTEIAIMNSAPIRQAVAAKVPEPDSVSIVPFSEESEIAVEDADVAVIVASDEDAGRVKPYAQAYAETYVAQRTAELASATNEAMAQLQEKISAIDGLVAGLNQTVAELDAQIIATYDAVVRNGLESQRAALLAERESREDESRGLRQQLVDLQLATLQSASIPRIISQASEPEETKEGQPRPVFLLAGALLGLMLGVIWAFARDHFDDAVRTTADLESAGKGAPVLAEIPDRRRHESVLAFDGSTPGGAAEAYHLARTSLHMATVPGKRVVLVCSANPDEGTTTVVANLGLALASLTTVTLIDANLRRPNLHHVFGLPNEVGLTSVVSGDAPVGEVAQRLPDEPNLRVLTAGPAVADPATWLSGVALPHWIGTVRAGADYVLVDGPPLLIAADTVVLANLVDAAVLVVRAGHTPRFDVSTAIQRIEPCGIPIVGSILNRAGPEARLRYASRQSRATVVDPEPAGDSARERPPSPQSAV